MRCYNLYSGKFKLNISHVLAVFLRLTFVRDYNSQKRSSNASEILSDNTNGVEKC